MLAEIELQFHRHHHSRLVEEGLSFCLTPDHDPLLERLRSLIE
jgi:hypothetical protein